MHQEAARRRRAKELLELADLVEIGQLHPDRARWLRLAAARLTAQP
jgi:Flp pilus assembly CpaF family ATPase